MSASSYIMFQIPNTIIRLQDVLSESNSYQASNHNITKTSPLKPLINQINDKNLILTSSIKLFRQRSVANLVDKQPPMTMSAFSLSKTLNIQVLKYVSSFPLAHQQDQKQLIFFTEMITTFLPYSSQSAKQHQSGIWTRLT